MKKSRVITGRVSMNKTVEQALSHRTIREFTKEPVTESELRMILDTANHTATSNGMQQASILRITDPAMRKDMAEVCKQEYITRCPELFVLIVDVYRNARIAEEMGKTPESRADMDRFFQGFTDACLMAQNMTTAIESMGMGAVYFGSILNDPKRMIEILGLPQLTFPVVGLGFGHPNQEPQLKPRMPVSLKVFENGYRVFDSYLEEIKDYDEEMQTYYDLRDANRRVDSFSNQVVTKLENVIEPRQKILQAVRDQGFLPGLDE